MKHSETTTSLVAKKIGVVKKKTYDNLKSNTLQIFKV